MEIQDCANTKDCQAFGTCIEACMDEACMNMCVSAHGEAAANAYFNQQGCLMCMACPADCKDQCS